MKKKPIAKKSRVKRVKPIAAAALEPEIRADELSGRVACSKKDDCLCLDCKAFRRDLWLNGEEARLRIAQTPKWDVMDYLGLGLLVVALGVAAWFGWTYYQLGLLRQNEVHQTLESLEIPGFVIMAGNLAS